MRERNSLTARPVVELDVGKVIFFFFNRKLAVLAIPSVDRRKLRQGGAADRRGSALAIGEVPQELIETVVAKAAGQSAVLHFLMAEHRHGGVAESTNINSLLKLGLSHGLDPPC